MQIFNSHISIVEGHLKMVDMVRKHTAEGSRDYQIICDIIDRTGKMLYDTKAAAQTFVHRQDYLEEQVPLGIFSEQSFLEQVPPSFQEDDQEQVPNFPSSEQDYLEQVPIDPSHPGYYFKTHKYGEAAQQSGNYVSQAKRNGQHIMPEGVEYESGQSKALSSSMLEQMRAKKVVQNGTSSVSASGSGSKPATAPRELNGASKKVRFSDLHQEASQPVGQVFFTDSQPTPVNTPSTLNPPQKRKEISPDEHPLEPVQARPEEARLPKKAKKSHVGQTTESHGVREDAKSPQISTSQTKGNTEQAPEEIQIEYDDITAELDKRMKEKEEKRRHKDWLKEEKKRKRDSEASTAEAAVDTAALTTEVEKPKKKKKKKSRKSEDAGTVDDIKPKRKSAVDGEEPGEGDGVAAAETDKPKKKRKKKANIEDDDTIMSDVANQDANDVQ
ncbi:MAG: hypothetical protein Q9223_006493 [Gallowayella weberi]